MEFGSKLITTSDKHIKLQIWDTVNVSLFRLDKKLSNPLHDLITEDLLELFWYMILPTENPLTTLVNGLKKLEVTLTIKYQ